MRRLGEDVVVVVDDGVGGHLSAASGMGATIIRGPYRDEETLVRSGVASARALALVEQDDVANLHAALTAQDLNGDLRVVMRLFNESLRRSAEALLHDCVALSASGIAAPLFVDAALHHDQELTMEIGGRKLVVREMTAEISPDTVLLALSRGRGDADAALLPVDAATGDLVVLDRAGTDESSTTVSTAPSRRRALHARRWFGAAHVAISVIADRRLRVLLVALLGLVGLGVAVFRIFAGLSIIDALYFTVTTVTTTGYGDISLLHQPPAIKMFGLALIVVGATVLALFYAVIIDAVVGVRLTRALGAVGIDTRDHVVVCGLGNVGTKVVSLLAQQGIAVVAVERDGDSTNTAATRRLGVPVVIADCSLQESLKSACVEHARCLIALTDDDVTNLETALNARNLCPDMHVVLRLFDHDLAARVDRTFNISVSRSVSALAAPAFAAALMEREVLSVIPIGHHVLVVAAVPIESGSDLDGGALDAAGIRNQAHPLCLRTSDGSFQWTASHMEAGDTLIVVATRSALSQIVTRGRARTPLFSRGHE
ncbi:MAG: hypothetical protein NVS2B16_07890 [Chloroflexota bacterium]